MIGNWCGLLSSGEGYFYAANSLKKLRSSRILSSAASILAAKSGSIAVSRTPSGASEIQLIPRPHAKASEHFLGQDSAGGIAGLGYLEPFVHTGVRRCLI